MSGKSRVNPGFPCKVRSYCGICQENDGLIQVMWENDDFIQAIWEKMGISP